MPSELFESESINVSCNKKGAYMNHCDYQIIEISPKDLIIEHGFNPREAVIGDLCYEQEPVKSAIISLKQAYKEGRRVDLIKVVKKDSKYVVRQGHCRYRALLLALAEELTSSSFQSYLCTTRIKSKNT